MLVKDFLLSYTVTEDDTNWYSPTETLVEFDFGCKFMFVT
jgi:hypothetical protein